MASEDRKKLAVSLVVISGNIGSGKTTLIDHLISSTKGSDTKIIFVKEPREEWGTILDDFYADPKQHALSFQLHVLESRTKCLQNAFNEAEEVCKNGQQCIVLSERCHLTDALFAIQLFRSGVMDEKQFDLYMRRLDDIQALIPAPDLHVYLKTDAQKCMERIHVRNIACELNISQEYLNNLHNLHERFFHQTDFNKDASAAEIPLCAARDSVVVVDNSKDGTSEERHDFAKSIFRTIRTRISDFRLSLPTNARVAVISV